MKLRSPEELQGSVHRVASIAEIRKPAGDGSLVALLSDRASTSDGDTWVVAPNRAAR